MPILQFPTDPERYPGEHQDLIDDLNAARQQLTDMFGIDSDLFRQIAAALRGGSLQALRDAQTEVKSYLRASFDQLLGNDQNNPEVLAEIAKKMAEIEASKPRDFLDWLASDPGTQE